LTPLVLGIKSIVRGVRSRLPSSFPTEQKSRQRLNGDLPPGAGRFIASENLTPLTTEWAEFVNPHHERYTSLCGSSVPECVRSGPLKNGLLSRIRG